MIGLGRRLRQSLAGLFAFAGVIFQLGDLAGQRDSTGAFGRDTEGTLKRFLIGLNRILRPVIF